MVNEKNKLIKELIIDVIFTLGLIVLTIIALFISCISVIKLKNIVFNYINKRNKKVEYIILTISYIIIFNFAYLENLQFAECAVMSVSILLTSVICPAT